MPLLLIIIALVAALSSSCTPLEEAAATSPLVGAERVEEHGVATVAETLSASRYTYMRLEGEPPGTWHVVMRRNPKPGDRVAWRGYAALDDFHSRTLGRTFERLVFTSITTTDSAAHASRNAK